MSRSSRLSLLLLALALSWPCVASASAQSAPSSAKAPSHAKSADEWWKHAVIYEIYPRSFQDTNGDGIGDLNGITSRLDYLQQLGVDAIWIAPMYPSPQVDFGYDVSDYTAVDAQYGTLADFDRLVAAGKQHHIRILLDMVLNHTSDKSAWFQESASSRTNPKADWYIWNDGKPDPTNGKARNAHQGPNGWVVPPNNWSSLFQGSAWEWNPARGQFYYHFFYKQQPDLNWHNPAVEKAMFDSMRFWLDRGVAGFRLDAITTLFEDPSLKDEPLTGKLDASGFPESNHTLTSGLPEVHDVLERLHGVLAAYPEDRVLVGEIYTANTAELRSWYGSPTHPQLQLPMDTLVGFHQEGDGITGAPNVALNLPHFRKYIAEMETELGDGWPLLVFDNHDNTRSWDRFAPPGSTPQQKLAIARIIATMLFTTRAASLMYYGEELGMTTETPKRKEDVKDPIGITGWPKEKGRDGERTPMQWNPSPPSAGFSTNPKPWLPIAPNYKQINVATEFATADSLLRWHQQLIALRRTHPALHNGKLTMLNTDDPNVLIYQRTLPGAPSIVVVLNMSATAQTVTVHAPEATTNASVHTLAASDASLRSTTSLENVTLPPFSSWIAELHPRK